MTRSCDMADITSAYGDVEGFIRLPVRLRGIATSIVRRMAMLRTRRALLGLNDLQLRDIGLEREDLQAGVSSGQSFDPGRLENLRHRALNHPLSREAL